MYENFFGLNAAPFQLVPDPLFFYDSDVHRSAIIKLRQAMRDNDGMVCVSGIPGAGKSELKRQLLSEIESKKTTIADIPLKSLRSKNILDCIASEFGIVNMGFVGDALWNNEMLLVKIQQELSLRASEGNKFVVLIDNAESLSIRSLAKLAQLCDVTKQGGAFVQCFLFGDGSLPERINSANIRTKNFRITELVLTALDESDSRRYVEHRLLQAGWSGVPEFTVEAHHYIHKISEGVPWHINLLCHRVLLEAYLKNLESISGELVAGFIPQENCINLDVSGSDVVLSTRVVSLDRYSNVKSTIGANYIQPESDSSAVAGNSLQETKATSYQGITVDEVTSNSDELPFSESDLANAFDATLDDNSKGDSGYDVSRVQANDCAFNVSANCSVNKGRKETVTDTVLQNMLSGLLSSRDRRFRVETTSSMLPSIVPVKGRARLYPMLCAPGKMHEPKPLDSFVNISGDTLCANNQQSTLQIAASASIVTSLIITLVIWIFSDGRTIGTRAVQSLTSVQSTASESQYTNNPSRDLTPNPFVNPDDLSRARKELY